jgi:hypothetical protein
MIRLANGGFRGVILIHGSARIQKQLELGSIGRLGKGDDPSACERIW